MRNKKFSKKLLCLCVLLIFLLGLLLLNVSLRMNPFDNGGCFSISFDKLPMSMANRVVIYTSDSSVEITDRDLICSITKETSCATNTDLRYEKTERWIEIYCGNTLIRRMRWEDNHGVIVVYHADLIHWIFPSTEGDGIVYPSSQLTAKLEAIIQPQ